MIQYGEVYFSRENPIFFFANIHFHIPFSGLPMCVFATLRGLGNTAVYFPNLGIDIRGGASADIAMRRADGALEIPKNQSVFWLAIGY